MNIVDSTCGYFEQLFIGIVSGLYFSIDLNARKPSSFLLCAIDTSILNIS